MQITIHILCLSYFEVDSPSELIYSSIQISNVLVLSLCYKLINFVFQIFPLFIPDLSAGFMS
jgi:hypothetical protein